MANVRLTREMIRAGAGPTGGFNGKQVECFGLTWRGLKKGWVDRLIGTEVPEEVYRRFLALKRERTPELPFDIQDGAEQEERGELLPHSEVFSRLRAKPQTAVEAADNHLKSIVSGLPAGWSDEVREIHERVQRRIAERRA